MSELIPNAAAELETEIVAAADLGAYVITQAERYSSTPVGERLLEFAFACYPAEEPAADLPDFELPVAFSRGAMLALRACDLARGGLYVASLAENCPSPQADAVEWREHNAEVGYLAASPYLPRLHTRWYQLGRPLVQQAAKDGFGAVMHLAYSRELVAAFVKSGQRELARDMGKPINWDVALRELAD